MRAEAIANLLTAIKLASDYMDLHYPGEGKTVVSVSIDALVELGVTFDEIEQGVIDSKSLRANKNGNSQRT